MMGFDATFWALLLLTCITICSDNNFIVTTTHNATLHKIIKDNNIIVRGEFDFGAGLKGFVASFDPLVEHMLTNDAEVLNVRKDVTFPPIDYVNEVRKNTLHRATQTNVTYGLDLLDGIVDGLYNYQGNGSGVDVYVLDTGVKVDHPDFEGRARWGFPYDGLQDDNNGHGTHVAGIVASKTYGVAKLANIIAVKVINDTGKGTLSELLLGLNYVLNTHKKSLKQKSVVNLSLTGAPDDDLEKAISIMVDQGIAFAAASGNKHVDACTLSPARMTNVFTTAAMGEFGYIGNFANYGKCVKMIAPGIRILSTCVEEPFCLKTGTSMASPFAAGALAQAYSLKKFDSVKDVYKYISTCARRDVVKGKLMDTPNLLLKTPKA
ncbi:subtilisin-like serine protease pepC [Acrasis kona]|uniref:Subtilisin-like serine protease pepC n=1 Tax=Acrasis kona TaxID=1008807 RepID=A0AAW2Z4W1_9EUKA